MTLINGQWIVGTVLSWFPLPPRMPMWLFRSAYVLSNNLFGMAPSSEVSVTDVSVNISASPEVNIPVRIYRPPKISRTDPTYISPVLSLVYFHGGGFVIGDIRSHDGFCSLLAKNANINVISVEYRRSPEHKYPIPLRDCLLSWNWIIEHAPDLGIESTRIGIGGDSAGGNVAAVLSTQRLEALLQERLAAAPAFQFLLYPLLDFRCTSESYRSYGKGYLLSRNMMDVFLDAYLNSREERESIVDISPLRGTDHRHVPDTLIVTAEFDVLKDEGIAYVQLLQQANVRVIHRHFPDCTHGFIGMAKYSPETQARLDDICALFVDYATDILESGHGSDCTS
eukprot:m.124415 g.124415  ORF g.124415 m.124415 type:complete len:339 (+) comp17281_c0_seq3:101-1117(+)